MSGSTMSQIDWSALGEIEGWLSEEAARLTEMISRSVNGGGVLELGVFKGKYLALAASLFEGPEYLEDARATIHRNIA
jgi:hypothetical protein